jgi:acyl-CoA reductase-like NAD-dependent aldehyde dehydrogenase
MSDSYSRIVSPTHLSRVKSLLYATKGDIVFGGESNDSKRFLAPTVVKDVNPDDPLMADEIFGPVLPIVPMPSKEAAIRFVNDRDHPLVLYVFSKDTNFINKGELFSPSWLHCD